ncbi:MAG: hypothetical protein ACRBBW_13140 [Cellvibrionaceae bacterium]
MSESTQLPLQPAGWRVLIKPVAIDEKSSGGIILAEESKKVMEHTRYIGQVVLMGPLCYEKKDFQKDGETQAFCKVGDWVAFRKHSGQEIRMKSDDGSVTSYKVVNDDEIIAVVNEPERIDIPL